MVPPLRLVLLWRNVVVAVAHDVQNVAAELTAAQWKAALHRATPFPIVSFSPLIGVLWEVI